MARFVKVIKSFKVLCSNTRCANCELARINNSKGLTCNDYIFGYPEEAEKIIMQWAAEHPIKTNADKFREVFGFYPVYNKCPGVIGYDACRNEGCHECEHKDFWEKEYKEPEQEEGI